MAAVTPIIETGWNRVANWWTEWIDRPFRPGMKIRQYQLVRVLGMGSYGITYLATDIQTNTRCVLKQVKPSRRKGEKGYPIFKREADILKQLHHPAFPRFIDQFENKRQLFLVMEYFEGPNMEDMIFDLGKQFSEREALEFILQLLQHVQVLHKKKLVHRDIRLPNVIYGKDQLHIIDFGLAQFLGQSPTAMAEDLGDYPLEKQLRREVEFKSDFYAMGHLLLFLLYTTFNGPETEEITWEEELEISSQTKRLLRKMLLLDPPFLHASELEKEIKTTLEGLNT